jgi:predicted transcriptional regulator
MAGIFDRLQKRIDEVRKEGGISVLDLASLPPALRKLMRLMLRQTKMHYSQLLAAIDQFPEGEALTRPSLDEALSRLTDQGWLIRIGDGEHAIYKVNLRRRAGSKLSTSIWQDLDSKLKK